MSGHDAGHFVLGQEAGDAGVVHALAITVVQPAPADLEFLPTAYSGVVDVGDRDSVGSALPISDLNIRGYR
jgi:hypothetical protein